MSKEGKDRNAPTKEEIRKRALEAGAGEEGAQRADQSGTTGKLKPEEIKSRKHKRNWSKTPMAWTIQLSLEKKSNKGRPHVSSVNLIQYIFSSVWCRTTYNFTSGN